MGNCQALGAGVIFRQISPLYANKSHYQLPITNYQAVNCILHFFAESLSLLVIG